MHKYKITKEIKDGRKEIRKELLKQLRPGIVTSVLAAAAMTSTIVGCEIKNELNIIDKNNPVNAAGLYFGEKLSNNKDIIFDGGKNIVYGYEATQGDNNIPHFEEAQKTVCDGKKRALKNVFKSVGRGLGNTVFPTAFSSLMAFFAATVIDEKINKKHLSKSE